MKVKWESLPHAWWHRFFTRIAGVNEEQGFILYDCSICSRYYSSFAQIKFTRDGSDVTRFILDLCYKNRKEP